MKKQLQLLSIAIAIVLVSCGRHNVEISRTITNGAKEATVNNSTVVNEADLLLIDIEGQIRFKDETGEHPNRYGSSFSGDNSSWTIGRETQLLVD